MSAENSVDAIWAELDAAMRRETVVPAGYYSAKQKASDWNLSCDRAARRLSALHRDGKLDRIKVGNEFFYGPRTPATQ